MNNEEPIVEMRKVCKRFGKIKALDDIDLQIYPGRIIGLLGANGAGKSTLLRNIIGLYLEDEGQCVTFGCEAQNLGPAELGRIGYVHQEGELLDWMTVGQFIRYVSTYYPNWNHELEEKYIKDFEISTKVRVGSLSPGQRQRLSILIAIGFEPELLILDEPAAALDPVARAQFLDLLLQIIQAENRTIIISSHILSDVEKVIDHAVIMKEGHILLDCSFDELRERFCQVRISALGGELPVELPFENILHCKRSDGQAILTVQDCPREKLQEQAKSLNCWVEIETLPLEEIYKIVVS
ncbi:MAG TPA: ABC transporter ATP-binding protein [Sedimentisphaerales bacterium]|nr:ABC transporter ATP-binding protein [Sedimentisphaerales bacterium]